jgi:hypothetical protein
MRLTDFSFTPSELILLNGDKFSPEAKDKEGHQLLCTEGTVSGPFLAGMCVAAAILGNHEENALEIEIKQKRGLLRSRSENMVCIHPAGAPPSWNGYTLESAILYTSGQLFGPGGDYSVRNVVYSLLLKDHKVPWKKILEIVEWGLASSNWLIPVEGEAAAAFQTPFICPAKVKDLAFAQPIEPVQNFLNDCKKNTPETWKLILAEIDQAFKDRKI